MAFPVDAARATTNSTTSSTTHSLNLPGSIASGDLLLAVVRCPASTTISWPAGWTEHEQSNADASDDETSLAFRVADGTEGATITITLGTARVLVGLCYRITGAVGLALGASVVGSATQPNSPSFTPLTAARDVLWISIGGCDDAETLTSGPSSYSNATVSASTATGTSGCTVYGASRQLNGATEDPGAWTLGSTSIWTAWTVAISDTAFPSRLTQEPVEAAVLPTTAAGRMTQEPVEVAVLPTSSKVRLTAEPVETLTLPTSSKLRMTSEPLEVLVKVEESDLRLTAMPVEVLVRYLHETYSVVIGD